MDVRNAWIKALLFYKIMIGRPSAKNLLLIKVLKVVKQSELDVEHESIKN